MHSKVEFPCNMNVIPECMKYVKTCFEELKLDREKSVHMSLAIEDILVKLIENAADDAKLKFEVGKSFSGIKLEITAKGKEFSIDDVKENLIFADKEENNESSAMDDVLISLADRIFSDGLSVKNVRGENRAYFMLKQTSQAVKIFAALVLAIICGLLLNGNEDFANSYIKPFGVIFLNLIKFIVCPIVLFSIMSGIVSMKDIGKVGKIGGITIVYYLFTTSIAIIIGLVGGSLFKGFFPVISTTSLSYEASEATPFMDVLVGFFPSNFIAPFLEANMLQVIVIAIILGFSVILVGDKASGAVDGINTLNSIFMKSMELILKLSPIGVFCLLTPVVAGNGPEVIGSLAKVLGVAYLCYFIHAIIVYSSSVAVMGKTNPITFFKEMLPAILFAFSSASSVGTLPLNMKCTEKLGVSKDISSFVLPLGATINMDGTAIYQGVCAIFIASCYGIDLTFSQMMTIVLTATLASIGTAGVPGAGVVMLAMVLTSVGLPVDGIAIVAGVDRIFDMGRTTLNITGDASCTVIVSGLLNRNSKK